jgi:hypothetical protein
MGSMLGYRSTGFLSRWELSNRQLGEVPRSREAATDPKKLTTAGKRRKLNQELGGLA